jgi:hypothetical protein
MSILGKAREAVVTAGEHVATAMRVAVLACILSVCALVVGLMALTRRAPGLADA